LNDEGQQQMVRVWSAQPEDGATQQEALKEPEIEDEADDQP
jgi:hypothetical protein